MLGLPDEILLNIFSEVKPFSVLPFRRVCKRWRCIIDTSTTLQLQIECLLDGRDLPAPGNSWAGELKKIRQSNLAWETLTPTKQSSSKVNDVKGSHLILHNGLVGLAHKSGRTLEIWEYHDATGFQSIAKHTHIGFHPGLYAFDRAQDVLVLLERLGQGKFKLHIRKLSTDGRHQDAAKAAIILECGNARRPVRFEIHGDCIAVLIGWRISAMSVTCFFLVDWKAGTILLDNMHRVYDFCFIDVRTILLALSASIECDWLQAISFPLDKAAVRSVTLDLPSLKEDHQHYSLELRTDGARLIGICVGINLVVQCFGDQNSNSNYLLVVDRPGLLEFLAREGADFLRELAEGPDFLPKLAGEGAHFLRRWAEWESEITAILPLKNNSYQMAWAVSGRRVVINAKAETLPFSKSRMEVADGHEAGNDGYESDESDEYQGFGYQEDPRNRERLIVVDFGCHRLPSVVEAGDASGNIIRCRTKRGSLRGIVEFPSKELPYRIWMERVPSCLPSELIQMSESMVLVVDENGKLDSIKSIRVF